MSATPHTNSYENIYRHIIGGGGRTCDRTLAGAPWEGSVSQEKRFDVDLARTFANRGFKRHSKGLSAENWDRVWESIKDYDRAIELDPYYALAFHNRGAAY